LKGVKRDPEARREWRGRKRMAAQREEEEEEEKKREKKRGIFDVFFSRGKFGASPFWDDWPLRTIPQAPRSGLTTPLRFSRSLVL
jgi:hypothetical protein